MPVVRTRAALCLCLATLLAVSGGRVEAGGGLSEARATAAAQQAIRRLRADFSGAPHWQVGVASANHLRLLGAPGARACIEAYRSAPDHPIDFRRRLLHVIADAPSPKVVSALLQAIGDADPVIRHIAADGLGRRRQGVDPDAQRLCTERLVAAAEDEAPGVRLAALRALFSLRAASAVEARKALPTRPTPNEEERRLTWHLRAGDGDAQVASRARTAFREASTWPLLMAAGDLLASAPVPATADDLQRVIEKLSMSPDAITPVLYGQHDAVRCRAIATRALLALLDHNACTPQLRHASIQRAIEWIAQPVPMDAWRRDPRPDLVLRQRLPDQGDIIVAPTIAGLRAGTFREPRAGVVLLRERGAAVARPALLDLIRYALEDMPARASLLTACTGVLTDMGEIGDAALARRLFFAPELARLIRLDMVQILSKDKGAWVAPLLDEASKSKDADLRDDAHRALQRRPEARARTVRVEAFFAHPEHRGQDRLAELVRLGDAPALEVLARALRDPRMSVRVIALSQITPNADALRTPEVLRLVRPLGATVKANDEVESFVRALVVLAPLEAVTWVREAWAKRLDDGMREAMLRQVHEVWTPEAERAAVDLALEKRKAHPALPNLDRAVAAVLAGRWLHRNDEVADVWRDMLAPGHALRALAPQWLAHEGAADLSTSLLRLLADVEAGTFPQDATTHQKSSIRDAIFGAFEMQPMAAVGATLVNAILDPRLPPGTRERACRAVAGRLDEASRWRLVRWLGWPMPKHRGAGDVGGTEAGQGANAPAEMQWLLAEVIGEGGGPEIARSLLAGVERELRAWIAAQPSLRLAADQRVRARAAASPVLGRLVALARGVARTRHPEAIQGLLRLLFDGRLGDIARRQLSEVDTQLVTGRGAPGRDVLIDFVPLHVGPDKRLTFGLPAPASHILSQVKVLDDELLATNLHRVLAETRADGRLARCPQAYLAMAVLHLLDAPTERRAASARAIGDVLEQIAPGEGGLASVVGGRLESVDTEARDFVAALERARRDRDQLAHRQLRREGSDSHRWARFRVMALEAAVAGAAGQSEAALALSRRALREGPHNPSYLNTIAWFLRETGTDLPWALQLAKRAARLERRIDAKPSRNTCDTLAMILLDMDKPRAAYSLLAPRAETADGAAAPVYFRHMAEIAARLGWMNKLEYWLGRALQEDPASAKALKTASWLAADDAQRALTRALRRCAESAS